MTGPGHWDLVSAGMNAKMTMTCFAYKWELSAVGYYRGILITAEAVQADPGASNITTAPDGFGFDKPKNKT
ncbi:MAG: hypothetical protein QOH60_3897 [Mycobacterium sp.]|jgi:hypothetical protein|nr:hypothetical protein [Mycobacterium sp.]